MQKINKITENIIHSIIFAIISIIILWIYDIIWWWWKFNLYYANIFYITSLIAYTIFWYIIIKNNWIKILYLIYLNLLWIIFITILNIYLTYFLK